MQLLQIIHSKLMRVLRWRVVIFALMLSASYVVAAHTASAFPGYLSNVPNASSTTFNTPGYAGNGCAVCHGSNGTGAMKAPFAAAGHSWTAGLAYADSDGDGYTNGEELQDPTHAWISGAIGTLNQVSNPSDAASSPPQPTLSAITGVSNGGMYQGVVSLGVTFDPTIGTLGARTVVFDVISGASVVASYSTQTDNTYGGYTTTAASFNYAWDTTGVANGAYTIRATLSDALKPNARTSQQNVGNVIVNNPAPPQAGTRYVAKTGTDTGDCLSSASPCLTIEYAVGQALPGDEVRVAAGTYTSANVLIITQALMLTGGFTTLNWNTPNPSANPTILDGQNNHAVLFFTAASGPNIVQNFTIQNGKDTTGNGGGGIYMSAQGSWIIRNTIFQNNTSTTSGGGLSAIGVNSGKLSNDTFTGNSALGGSGGAVSLLNVTANINNTTFTNNTATSDGGALHLFSSPSTIGDVSFSTNSASGGNGGAVFMDNASAPSSFSAASFRGNSASGSGGGIFSTAASFAVTNALFANNSASQGAAITASSMDSVAISYATIAGNGAVTAALSFTNTGNGNSGKTIVLTDTLISGYSTGILFTGSAQPAQSIQLNLQHVLIANDGSNNVATPISNTNGDPVTGTPIRDLAGYTNAAGGDYHLAFGAPAIDAGAATTSITSDLDGQSRLFGGATDIGAYEFSGPVGAVVFFTHNFDVILPTNQASVLVRITVPSLAPVTVHYATHDATAIAGTDYTAVNGTLTIAAGKISNAFDIPILDAGSNEQRVFTIELSSPTGGATLGADSSATVTIKPPESIGPPTVSITASTPHAARSGPIPALFTLERDVGIDTALTINYTVGGDAVPGVDYQALPGSLTIPIGQFSATIPIVPIGGSGYKIVTVTVSPSGDYNRGRSSATVDISDSAGFRVHLPLALR
jgi:predicted outer membrane repeat protein